MYHLDLLSLGLAIAGLCSGIFAGLFGIGAGSLMVPLLIAYFSARGVGLAQTGLMAIATSLAAILVISSRAFFTHWRLGAGSLRLILAMAPLGMAGSILGAHLALVAGGQSVVLAFAILELGLGLRYALQPKSANLTANARHRGAYIALTGLASGFCSAFFGVGGGIVAVPMQIRLLGLGIHQAIANSSGLIVVNAAIAAGRYGIESSPPLELPLVGLIDILAAGLLALGGLVGAPLGAKLAHRLDAVTLKRYFGYLLVAIAGTLMWKAWPSP